MIDARRLGWFAVIADVAITAILTAFLLIATDGQLDAVPRPIALLALYASPGVIGAIGVARERRSLLLAAAIVLVPGSVLSMAGVTLVFVLPMVLFAAAAASMGAARGGLVAAIAETTVVAGLVLAAGFALFALTGNSCATSDGATSCGSGLLTVQGVAVELGLLAAAILFAGWRARLSTGLGRRPAP